MDCLTCIKHILGGSVMIIRLVWIRILFFCFQNLKPTIWVPSNQPKNQNWTTLVYMSKQTRSLGEKHSARFFNSFPKSWRCGRLTPILLAYVSNYTGGLILRRYYKCWNWVVTRIGLQEFGSVNKIYTIL